MGTEYRCRRQVTLLGAAGPASVALAPRSGGLGAAHSQDQVTLQMELSRGEARAPANTSNAFTSKKEASGCSRRRQICICVRPQKLPCFLASDLDPPGRGASLPPWASRHRLTGSLVAPLVAGERPATWVRAARVVIVAWCPRGGHAQLWPSTGRGRRAHPLSAEEDFDFDFGRRLTRTSGFPIPEDNPARGHQHPRGNRTAGGGRSQGLQTGLKALGGKTQAHVSTATSGTGGSNSHVALPPRGPGTRTQILLCLREEQGRGSEKCWKACGPGVIGVWWAGHRVCP